MTTLALYMALYLGAGQSRAEQYCYEAEYTLPIQQAYIEIQEWKKEKNKFKIMMWSIDMEYAKENATEKEQVCNKILKLNQY